MTEDLGVKLDENLFIFFLNLVKIFSFFFPMPPHVLSDFVVVPPQAVAEV